MKDVDFQNLVQKLTNDEALAVFPDFDSASLGKLVYSISEMTICLWSIYSVHELNRANSSY